MILLDTKVISEPLRPTPEPRVIEWIDAQPLETLFLSSVTVAELRTGVALLPDGKRRSGLQENLETRVLTLFTTRVLPFDLACTHAYAEVVAKARKQAVVISAANGFVAAIAVANGFAVATRDSGPFAVAGVTVIDPWRGERPQSW